MVAVGFGYMPLERVFRLQNARTTHPNVEIRRLHVLAELSCGPKSGVHTANKQVHAEDIAAWWTCRMAMRFSFEIQ